MAFSQLTVEAVGWYVYLLIDSQDGMPFYVGKGSGQRAFQHAAEAKDLHDHPELQKAKHERILAIEASGAEVRVEILRHALESSDHAYTVESAAIDLLHRVRPGSLLNEVAGHESEAYGLESAGELEIRYAAEPAVDPGCPIVLTSLDQSWYPGISPGDLQEFTARWWRLDPDVNPRPVYLFGVHRKIIRSAYRITGWEDRKPGDRGWDPDKPHRRGFTEVFSCAQQTGG